MDGMQRAGIGVGLHRRVAQLRDGGDRGPPDVDLDRFAAGVQPDRPQHGRPGVAGQQAGRALRQLAPGCSGVLMSGLYSVAPRRQVSSASAPPGATNELTSAIA